MMLRAAALVLLLVAGPALAQARTFSIAGEAFAEADIIDARAFPDPSGSAIIMISLSDTASQRLAAATKRAVEKKIAIVLDGKILSEPVVHEPIEGGQFQWSGLGVTITQADALALRISGKPPLPESLED